MKLKFSVNNQKLMRQDSVCLSSGTANCVECEFAFSNEWKEYEKIAIFSNRNACYHAVLTDNKCIVPEEIITDTFGVSVFGTLGTGNDYRRITVDTVFVEVLENGYVRGKTPPETSEENKKQMMSQIETIKEEIEKSRQQLTSLQKETDEVSTSTSSDMKNLKNSSKNCSDAVCAIKEKTDKIPEEYSQKIHSHTIGDIVDLPSVPIQISDIENDCEYTRDTDYVHTDNNFTSAEKQKLEGLSNYNDSTVQSDVKKKMPVLKADSTGYPAVIEKHGEGKSLLMCRIYGSNTGVGNYNESTGKYCIPITLCGKNMVLYPYRDKNKNTNGVTWTCDINGTVTVSGSTTDTATYTFFDLLPITHGQKYIFSTGETDKKNIDFRVTTWDKNKKFISQIIFNADTYVTEFSDNVHYIGFYMSRIAINTECTGIFKPQLEYGTTSSEYEQYVAPTKATVTLDSPLTEGEYIDLMRKKRVSGSDETDITVEGELKTVASSKNYVTCDADNPPSRIEVMYQQDVSKVLAELKSAILSLGVVS